MVGKNHTKRSSRPLLGAAVTVALMTLLMPSAGAVGLSAGPIGFDVGTGSGGAGTAHAACDLLATACAGTAAAVHHQEATATGTIPFLGTGSITVEADFGVATAAFAVRVVASAAGNGETSVTSTYEEEKIVKGDDKCQWYNPADWGGHCDPDQTVKYHVDKEDPNACPMQYNIVLDPSLAGDWIADGCESTAGDDVVCMKAHAEADAASNVGDAKPAPSDATNCDSDAAIRMAQLFASDAVQIADINSIDKAETPYLIQISDLPADLRQSLLSETKQAVLGTIEASLAANYVGPEGGQARITSQVLERVSHVMDDYDGPAIVYFTPSDGAA